MFSNKQSRLPARVGRLLVCLILPLSLLGCAVIDKREYKEWISEKSPTPVKAERAMDGRVRLESAYAISPERREAIIQGLLSEDTPDNYCAAMGELVAEDMTRSGVFASVNTPGPGGYDALVRLDCLEDTKDAPQRVTLAGPFRVTIKVSVLDPSGKELVAQYQQSQHFYHTMDTGWGAAMRVIRPMLANMRAQMLADLGGGSGLKAAMATKRAVATAQDSLNKAQTSDYAGAWAALRQALAQDQRSPAPALAAATLLARLCDAEGARAMQAEAMRRGAGGPAQVPAEPDQRACQAQALNKDGVALARQGAAAEAMAKFDQALKTAPAPLPKANYNAALVMEQQGQAQAAVRQYLAAYQAFLLPAEQTEALNRLLALSQHAKLGVPETADQRYRLGVVRAKQKRYAEAVGEFEAALQEAPWLVDAYYNLGLVYDFVGRSADALRVLRIYVQLAPNSANLGPVKTKIVELEDKLGLITPK